MYSFDKTVNILYSHIMIKLNYNHTYYCYTLATDCGEWFIKFKTMRKLQLERVMIILGVSDGFGF